MDIINRIGGAQRGYGSTLGINRRTWNMGRAIGRGLKRAYDNYSKSASTRPHKKPKVTRPRKVVKTKTPILTGVVMNEGTGGQYSSFVGPKGKCYLPPHVENALPPQVAVTNGAQQLKSAIGLQNVAVVGFLMESSLATGYTSDKITRVLYEKGSLDVTMNNIYLSNAYIIIYDIFARKDVANSSIASPLLAWSQGNTDESSSNAFTNLGSTPWQSELFNQYYYVKQVTNIVLCAGGTHVHKVRLNPNKMISSAYATYSPNAFHDLTYFCMVEVHGSPANDTMTQSQVTVGAGGLNIIVDKEETIKQLNKSTPTLSVSNNLLTAFTNAEQVVNLGGSTVTTNIEG